LRHTLGLLLELNISGTIFLKNSLRALSRNNSKAGDAVLILNIFATRKLPFSSRMFWKLILLCILVVFTFSNSVQAKQYGILLEESGYQSYASAEADQALERIAATGVEWTSLVAWQMADNINSTTIYPSSQSGITPSDDALIHAIKKAHSLGLKVMLYPHLELANDPSHWFGEIGKNFGSDQWDEWFDSYTQFISHYAFLE